MSHDAIRSSGSELRGVLLAAPAEPAPETAWIEMFNSSSHSVRFEQIVLYGDGTEETVELGETVKPGDFIDLDLAGRGIRLTHAQLTLVVSGQSRTEPIGTLGGEELLWASIGIDDAPGQDVWVLAWYVQPL